MVECGFETCYFENQFQNYCLVYLPNNNPNCSIPCQRQYCDHDLMSDMVCPLWVCVPSSTTSTTTIGTTSTGTTDWTTTTTTSPPDEPTVSAVISYSFNGIMASFLLLCLCWALKKVCQKRSNRNREIPLPRVVFSITDSPLSTSSSDNRPNASAHITSFSNESADETLKLMTKKTCRQNASKNTKGASQFHKEMKTFIDLHFDDLGRPLTTEGSNYVEAKIASQYNVEKLYSVPLEEDTQTNLYFD